MGARGREVLPPVCLRTLRHRLPHRGGQDLERSTPAQLHGPLQAQRHLQGPRSRDDNVFQCCCRMKLKLSPYLIDLRRGRLYPENLGLETRRNLLGRAVDWVRNADAESLKYVLQWVV